jgi:hypothetical protein
MSDDKKRMNTDPELKLVPRELRPFVRKLENPVVRPGDDPQLDDAVARLRALSGMTSGDPLYYEAPRPEEDEGGGERGIGNVRVYVMPVAPPGAETLKDEAPGDAKSEEAAPKGERKRRGVIVAVAAVGIGVATLAAMTGRGGRVEREGELRAAGAAGVVEERAPRCASAADAGAEAVAAAQAGAVAEADAAARGAVSSVAAPSARRAPAPARPAVRAPKASQRDKPAKEVAPPSVETPQAAPSLDWTVYR